MKMWKVFRGHSVIALGLLVTAFIFASLVSATPITPGTNTTSPTLFSGSQGTTDTSISVPFTILTVDAGTVSEWVVTDSGTGDLDYIYQVDVTQGNVTSVTVSNFGSLASVNVGYMTDGTYGSPGTGTVSQVSSGIGANLGTIGFTLGTLGVNAPGFTDDLVVKTTSTTYTSGLISVQDSGATTISGLGPTPEPGSVGLLLGGLFGLGLFVTRRFRVQQS
jgi:hypothetical protein